MSSPISDSSSKVNPSDQLIQLISPWVALLGYRIIHLEMQSHRQKVLRIYIDFLESSPEGSIGIEDCVKVSRALDESLDQNSEVAQLLPSAYELEVSSPGANRPLRTPNDFERFKGQEVRIHVYRPITGEELNNQGYQEKNPKQKNFKGTLIGLQENKVVLSVSNPEKVTQKFSKKGKAGKKAELTTNSAEGATIMIPFPLISKANLEPEFSFEGSDERE